MHRSRRWLPLLVLLAVLLAPVSLVGARQQEAVAAVPGFTAGEGATVAIVAAQVDALPEGATFVLHQHTVTDATPLVTSGDASLILPVTGQATVTGADGVAAPLAATGATVPAGATASIGSAAGATVLVASLSPGATAKTAGALYSGALEANVAVPFSFFLARIELAPGASLTGATVGQTGIVSTDADLTIAQPNADPQTFPAGRSGAAPAGARLAFANPGQAQTALLLTGAEPLHPPVVAAAPLDPAIPVNGYTIGDPNAPLLIVEYGDYQCPFCAQFHTDGFDPLLASYIATGKVRFEFRPFSFLGQESLDAAAATQCAAQQNLFWPMHNTIYANHHGENQGAMSPERLREMAELSGLDLVAYDTCMADPATATWVQSANDAARAVGVRSTPTLFIDDIAVGWSTWPALELMVKGGLYD